MEMTLLLLLLCARVCYTAANSRLRKFSVIQLRCNWTTALSYCKSNHSTLATMYNQEEYEQQKQLLRNGISNAWIGLNRQRYRLKWSNGDPVNASAWPSLPSENQYSYCASMHTNTTWSLCTDPKIFMCYGNGPGDSFPQYRLIKQNLTWYEAQNYCRYNLIDLVSIMNERQKEEVKNCGMNSTTPFWIGLLYDDWEWADGGKSAYRKWSTIAPYPKENILRNYTYLMKSLEDIFTVSLKNKCDGAICSEGSVRVHIIREKKIWEDALNYCNKHHDGLLRFESAEDLSAIDQQLKGTNLTGPVWIGLRQSSLFGFWVWTNGLSVNPEDWSNWEGGIWPQLPLSHQCGAMETKKGYKWVDQDCLSQLYFVCEELI
ncbi:secretory phospholipase A2 receptor [Esox lucius]|uniref:C-type lectin domain-containing protein n=1 Tax=Esox lucius TaxID=8010 RepID=A0A3P9AAT4_ESOLU|nr:secretory phospholipase A2 receptor [Esox lucius]